MAKLRVKDKVNLGKIIVAASRDDVLRQALLSNPRAVLSDVVDIPLGHNIIVHEDTGEQTHIMIPWVEDVKNSLTSIGNIGYSYPAEYNPSSRNYIDPALEPVPPEDVPDGYKFRVGDYTLSRCA